MANLSNPHCKSVQEVLNFYKVDPNQGLSSAQVEEYRAKYGPNALEEQEKLATVAMPSRAYVEPFVILTILILNAVIAIWQDDSKAEKALDALKKLAPECAMVLRNGDWQSTLAVLGSWQLLRHLRLGIDAEDVVPGDILEVRVGDKVMQLKTTTIKIEQSQLTGESQSVTKEVVPLRETEGKTWVIQEKYNLLFSSTTVSNGACTACVVATGMSTEIGKIQAAVTTLHQDEEQTPLQQKLDEFGNLLAKMIGVICLLVWMINYKHFFDPVHGSVVKGCIYYFKIAVALAVAAIPEGLPAVITTCLALGTRQMAKRNAIVRKLPSVETLGCTTVICSDKTGTLTTNEMCVVKLAMPSSSGMKSWDVEGHNYTPVGTVSGMSIDWSQAQALQVLAKVGCMCSLAGCTARGRDLELQGAAHSPNGNESRLLVDDEEKFIRNGEPTEAAIRVLVEKLGCPDDTLNQRLGSRWQVFEGPKHGEESCPGVQPRSQIHERAVARQQQWQQCYDGSHDHPGHSILAEPSAFIEVENEMTFVGMVGILDPPRPECKPAIEACRVAGISVIMITGDNKTTAEAISSLELALLVVLEICLQWWASTILGHHPWWLHLGHEVKILKSLDEIAAMTGDGVNDAPALKQADIGIAMGIAGTEEASDMVLADDNFTSIVAAVEEGRISSNVGEVAAIFLTAALGVACPSAAVPEGLTPVQLLWVNLVTDGPPATALGFNPPDLDVMSKAGNCLAPAGKRMGPTPERRRVDFSVVLRALLRGGYWYIFDVADDNHTLVSLDQLLTWGSCQEWKDFRVNDIGGSSSLAALDCLRVLVVIEMLNAFNALSEDARHSGVISMEATGSPGEPTVKIYRVVLVADCRCKPAWKRVNFTPN
eukprot:Skav203837  [mRNA]  locus=scaffold4932:92363:112059:- [translate_table: standard]